MHLEGFSITVCSENPGNPIQDALILFSPLEPKGRLQEFRTDENGEVAAKLKPKGHYRVSISADGHYPALVQNLSQEEELINLKRLPVAKGHLGWWHGTIGITEFNPDAGTSISIGIIDSGIVSHQDLTVIDCGSVENGTFHTADKLPGRDRVGHGTAVASLICSKPKLPDSHSGIVPGAKVYSVKAFNPVLDHLTTGTQSEIDEAIYHLVNHVGVHLINCSFSDPLPSSSTTQIIEEAYEKGVVCVCAAGNDPAGVGFPANLQRTVAVSALGLTQCIESNPIYLHYAPIEHSPERRHDYFIGTFSGRGMQVDCCAPGVGVIGASIPRSGKDGYGILFGTSFAAPLVCGILARSLSEDAHFHRMGPTRDRSDYVLKKLEKMCRPLGFDTTLEGRGCPSL